MPRSWLWRQTHDLRATVYRTPRDRAVDVLIGFVGWFGLHTLYWGPILLSADGLDEAAIVLLYCFLVPLPLNLIVGFQLGRLRRWVVPGALLAIVANIIGIVLTTPAGTALGSMLSMVPFYLYDWGALS